jgi:GPH family glycoside/pentoside/hexuronide:cation symporter
MAAATGSSTLGRFEKIGYGLGDAACNIVFQMSMTFMAYFYTDIFGLGPAAMGTMLLIVRAVTSLLDPVMGVICDRTETRWGKFRPYLLWMAPLLAVLAVLTFTTPAFSPPGKLIYAYATYGLLMITYTAINVPYCSLGAVLTRDSRERVSINGWRFFLVTGVGALFAFTALPMIERLGAGDSALGFQRTMIVFAIAALVMLWTCFATTRERVVATSQESRSIRRDVACLVRNDQWRVTAAINFVLFIALAVQDGLAIGYLTWYVGRKDLVAVFLTTGMLSAMAGAMCAKPLIAHMNKGSAYAAVQAGIVAALVTLMLVGKSHLAALFAAYAVIEFLTKTASALLWSMMADVVDYGELLTGRRITGLAFSGSLLSLKLGAAVGGALLGWLLAWVGYQGQAASQSAAACGGILVIFTLVPAVGHLALIVIVRGYRLDNARTLEIREELERAHATGGVMESMDVQQA